MVAGGEPQYRQTQRSPDDRWSEGEGARVRLGAHGQDRGAERVADRADDAEHRAHRDGQIFAATPVDTWQAYLVYHFISDHAQYLPKAFDEAKFDFFAKTLAGVQAQRERWKRGVELVNGALGEAVGAVYVAKYFPPAAERQIAELIENLRGAYEQRITNSPWMDEATKKAALAKLAAFEPRIGHPVKYIDYSSIKVERRDLLGNAMAVAEFQNQLQLQRLPKPVDRTLWAMTPQTVNAYYSPLSNQITFPAAILQPPFFDANADPAVNYGAIGAIIGHEMGHGFDDQGSQFGPTGKFENWWTDAAKKAFKDRTAALRPSTTPTSRCRARTSRAG